MSSKIRADSVNAEKCHGGQRQPDIGEMPQQRWRLPDFHKFPHDLVTQASPLAKIAPYGLLNMNLTWNGVSGSSIDAELFASNITNRFYYNNVSEFFDTAFGFESRYLGEPRMYGARVRLRFGK